MAYLVSLKWGVDVDEYLERHELDRLAEDCAAFELLDKQYAEAYRRAQQDARRKPPRPLSGRG